MASWYMSRFSYHVDLILRHSDGEALADGPVCHVVLGIVSYIREDLAPTLIASASSLTRHTSSHQPTQDQQGRPGLEDRHTGVAPFDTASNSAPSTSTSSYSLRSTPNAALDHPR